MVMKGYWGLMMVLAVGWCDLFLGEKYVYGFFSLGEHRHNAELYYILFKSRDNNPKAPLVFFFEGGPGTTSIHAVFFQNGPFRIKDDMTLEKNEFSYNNIADVLYVDQPVGTGFSNVTNTSWVPHHETVILADLLTFLRAFFDKYPEYKQRPLYLVSQGYGSHFVLPLANMLSIGALPEARLEGIALGNPWIRPELQESSLPAFSKRNGLCNEFQYIASLYGSILGSIFVDLDLDMQALDIYSMATGILIGVQNHKFNRLDMRIKCETGHCNYDFSKLSRFVIRADVRRAMGTTNREFHYHSTEVHRWLVLKNEYFSDKSNHLITLINDTNIPVYLCTGMQDWWYNTFGLDQVVASLHWHWRDHMANTHWRDWYSDGKWAGKFKRARHFYYVHVKDAGHFVSMDHPAFALDLLVRLTYGSN